MQLSILARRMLLILQVGQHSRILVNSATDVAKVGLALRLKLIGASLLNAVDVLVQGLHFFGASFISCELNVRRDVTTVFDALK